MRKKSKGFGRKRRTRGHIIADLAVNHAERLVLRCGYTMGRIVNDYGLDAGITTHDSQGGVENGMIWLQFKASDRPAFSTDHSFVSLSVERKDLIYWMAEIYPVMVIFFDARVERGYWLHVQEELKGGRAFLLDHKGSSITLRISTSQILDEDAVRHWRQLKAMALRRWQKGE